MPPDELCAKLFKVATELRDAGLAVCQTIICDTEPFIELENRVYAVNDVFEEIEKWLRKDAQ